MTTGDPTDERRRRAQWMAGAQQGDGAAYRALLDDIAPMVRRFARQRVRDADDADDLYQEIVMALHRARHTYEPTRPFEPWFFAIARRVAARRHGERVARDARELLVRTTPEIAVDGDGDVKLALERALLHLPPEQRQAFELLKLDGLSVDAAAPRAHTTVGALKVRAHRAYRALRRFL